MISMHLYFVVGHEFGERVIGNLVNSLNFCRSCDLRCSRCRVGYGTYAQDIIGVNTIKHELPQLIDEPEGYLPMNPPQCDILITIGIHPDILLTLPQMVGRTGARGVIVPIEDRRWCPPALRSKLQIELDAIGVDHAFPKPFCSLAESGMPTIDQFIRTYRVGRPVIEIELEDDQAENVTVLRSAPCGYTWYVAEQLKSHGIPEIEQITSNAFRGYPCTASRDIDHGLGDTIMHKAGYIIRDNVLDAIQQASLPNKPSIEPWSDAAREV